MMKLITFTLLIYALIPIAACNTSPHPFEGTWIGTKKFDFPSEKIGDKWYHEYTLYIKGNKVWIEAVPIVINAGVKSYSASDGGFFYYEGGLIKEGNNYVVECNLIYYDYVVVPKESGIRLIRYYLTATNENTIILGDIEYKRDSSGRDMEKLIKAIKNSANRQKKKAGL